MRCIPIAIAIAIASLAGATRLSWNWPVPDELTGAAAVELLVRARVQEGFSVVRSHDRHGMLVAVSFFKVVGGAFFACFIATPSFCCCFF